MADATEFDLEFEQIYMVNNGGTSDHSSLTNRNQPNQHTIESITGLMDILANTPAIAGECDGGCLPVFEETEEGTVALASSGINVQRVAAIVNGYEHVQDTPEMLWKITHNLNRVPSVTVIDTNGNITIGDIKYVDANSLEIKFSKALVGKAYIS